MKVAATACALLACVASATSQVQGTSSPAAGVADKWLAAPGLTGTQTQVFAVPGASLLVGMLDVAPQIILGYCESAAPEIRADLTAETAKFKASLTVSIKTWHYTHLFILHVRNDGCKRTV